MGNLVRIFAAVSMTFAIGVGTAAGDDNPDAVCCICDCDSQNETMGLATTSGTVGGAVCAEVQTAGECGTACEGAAGCASATATPGPCSAVAECAETSATMAPTLSLAGLTAMCALLAGLGAYRVRRRRTRV